MYLKINEILNSDLSNYDKQLKIEYNLTDFLRKEILSILKKVYFLKNMDLIY
jgi:hypothetical protein